MPDETAAAAAAASNGNTNGTLKQQTPLRHHLQANRIYIAGSAIVILLYKQGVVAFILVIVVAFVATSFQETRHVVDALLGRSLSGRQRLDKDGDQSSKATTNDTKKASPTSSLSLMPLKVPRELQTPLTQLVDLVERDFIEYWYSTSVALTPGTPFPQYTRSLMNEFLTTLVALIRRQDAKVTALSLAQAASRLLCTEIAHKRTGPPLHIDRAQQTEDFRRCSQQLVTEIVPVSAGQSALVHTLLTEVLAMQLQATVKSFSGDYINQMIVANLGKAVAIAKAVKRDAETYDVKGNDSPQQAVQGLQPSYEVLSPRRGSSAARSTQVQVPSATTNSESAVETPPPLPKRPERGYDVASRAESIVLDAESSNPSGGYTYAASNVPHHIFQSSGTQPSTAPSSPRVNQEGSHRASLGIGSPGPIQGIPTSPRTHGSTDNGRVQYRLTSPSTNDRFGDKSLEDAIEEGAFKLKKFGKNFLNKAEKLLDQLEEETQGGRSHGMSNRSRSLAGSLAGSPRSARSVPLTSPTHSKQSSEARPSGTSSGIPQARSGTPGDIRRLVSDLDLSAIDPSLQYRIEQSLASRDLEYLLPAPIDEAFKAVLTRQSPRGSTNPADQHIVQLAEDFQQYLEQEPSGSGEGLHRSWIQLEHFTYMIEETQSSASQIQSDALAQLRRVARANPVDYVSGSELFEGAYWTAVELVLLRILQNPTAAVFEPLQEWLMRVLSEEYWRRFLKHSGRETPSDPNVSATDLGYASLRQTDADLGSSMQDVGTINVSGDRVAVSRRASPAPHDLSPSDNDEDIASQSTHLLDASIEDTAGVERRIASSDDRADQSTDSLVAIDSVPAFTVTLTDISEPSAYQNDQVRNKRDLHFMIAVEVEGQPGYILTRRYPEFEQMDAGIKKALPQSGTRDFPRAPLPATKFQTSANLCRSLEQYLTALLHDDRYAACEPVAAFFAKERTDAKGDVQPLAFLGRGVSNIGKGVTGVTRGIGKSGEAAGRGIATGLSSITTAVTTLPRLRKMPSSNDASTACTPTKRSSMASLKDVFNRQGSPGTALSPALPTTPTKSEERLIDLDDAVMSPPNERSIQHADSYATPDVAKGLNHSALSNEASNNGHALDADSQGYDLAPPTHVPSITVEATDKTSIEFAPAKADEGRSTTPSVSHESGRISFEQLLEADTALTESPPATTSDATNGGAGASSREDSQRQSTTSKPPDPPAHTPTPARDIELNPQEYNDLLAFAMAILEESYDVNGSAWNIRRSMLKVVESVLRTSYADVIKTAAARIIGTLTTSKFYVKNINKMTDSFWPPPQRIWWSSVLGRVDSTRSAKEKEETRLLARQLLVNAAPDGLRTALGYRATTEAIGRIHDALQGEGAERIVTRLVLNFANQLFL